VVATASPASGDREEGAFAASPVDGEDGAVATASHASGDGEEGAVAAASPAHCRPAATCLAALRREYACLSYTLH
jgi:hypothetical protein